MQIYSQCHLFSAIVLYESSRAYIFFFITCLYSLLFCLLYVCALSCLPSRRSEVRMPHATEFSSHIQTTTAMLGSF